MMHRRYSVLHTLGEWESELAGLEESISFAKDSLLRVHTNAAELESYLPHFLRRDLATATLTAPGAGGGGTRDKKVSTTTPVSPAGEESITAAAGGVSGGLLPVAALGEGPAAAPPPASPFTFHLPKEILEEIAASKNTLASPPSSLVAWANSYQRDMTTELAFETAAATGDAGTNPSPNPLPLSPFLARLDVTSGVPAKVSAAEAFLSEKAAKPRIPTPAPPPPPTSFTPPSPYAALLDPHAFPTPEGEGGWSYSPSYSSLSPNSTPMAPYKLLSIALPSHNPNSAGAAAGGAANVEEFQILVTTFSTLHARAAHLRCAQFSLLGAFNEKLALLWRERAQLEHTLASVAVRRGILEEELDVLGELAHKDRALEARMTKAVGEKLRMGSLVTAAGAKIAEKRAAMEGALAREKPLLTQLEEMAGGTSNPLYPALHKAYKRRLAASEMPVWTPPASQLNDGPNEGGEVGEAKGGEGDGEEDEEDDEDDSNSDDDAGA